MKRKGSVSFRSEFDPFVDGIKLFGPKTSLVPLPGLFYDSLMKLFLKILANKFCTRFSSFSRIDKFHKL